MEQIGQERVWEIIHDVHICMLVTDGPEGLRARPLDARPDRKERTINFLTDVRGTKDNEIEKDSHICLIFIDPKTKAYLSVTGKAAIVRDRGLARKFWKKPDEVWWPEHEADPNLRVLRVSPVYAELWDGPANPAVAAHEFAVARATGAKPNLGENRKTVIPMNERC